MLERPSTEEEDELELLLAVVGGGRVANHACVLSLPLARALCGAESGHELIEKGWILQTDAHDFEDRVFTF